MFSKTERKSRAIGIVTGWEVSLRRGRKGKFPTLRECCLFLFFKVKKKNATQP